MSPHAIERRIPLSPPGSVTAVRPTSASLVLARTPHPSAVAVAEALAGAFLASAGWTSAELIDAGALLFGAHRRWMPPLVRELLVIFHRPPHDSPRELSGAIIRSRVYTDALERADRAGSPLQLRYVPLTPAHARTSAGLLPLLNTTTDLASLLRLTCGELSWFADTQQWNRKAPPGALQHYRYAWRVRPGRTPRLLEVPGRRLRGIQRMLLEQILGLIPVSTAAHGFIPGRSAASGAARHVGSPMVICLDLTTFFAHVSGGRIFGTLRQSGVPESVAHAITGLCTTAVPARVLSGMPFGGSPEQRFALRHALGAIHLPQGAPSSPMLANLAIRRLDSRLTGWAGAVDATYTRYADDLIFSGSHALAGRPDAFIRGVERIVVSEGHTVNSAKTRVRRHGVRQTVTGIVVNERLNVSRPEYDRLKATIHNCLATGPQRQNRGGVADFRAHLLGRILWVSSLNPSRGAQLRSEFDLIEWSE